jgi:tetratricopeptide (TPR) repeat protein
MESQTEPTGSRAFNSTWRPAHAYLTAVICFVVGCAIGYFLRGSAPPKPVAAAITAAEDAPSASSTPDTAEPTPVKKPSLDDMKRMGDKQAQPLLTELRKKPSDAALLNKTALAYKAAHQFDKAAEYFRKSLEIDPKNVAVRADYASCLYYMGDVDGALAQLEKSLGYDPKHIGTLYNIGMIEWKGKGNIDAAVAVWQKLLKLNPGLPQKDKEQIQHVIEVAQQSKTTIAENK